MPLDVGLCLCHALDAALFAKDRLAFRPDPWQEQLLRSTSRWILLNCCRQSGKSTTTAIVGSCSHQVHHSRYVSSFFLLVSQNSGAGQ
jgi:hypothetical protein